MRSVHNRKTHLNFIAIFCLILILVFSMTGCRQSPTLVDNIYTKDATQVDPDQSTASEDLSGEQDEFATAKDKTEEIKPDTKEQTAAISQTEAEPEQTARTANSSENGNNSLPGQDETVKSGNSSAGQTGGSSDNNDNGSGEGMQTGGSDTDTSESGSTNDQSPEKTKEDETTQNETPDANADGPSENNGDNNYSEPENTGGNGETAPSKWDLPRKTVTDGTGNEYNIPRDVYKVTAVGAAAPIVEMVGGAGRLMASSENFTYGNLANAICQDVAGGTVQTWWSGDGTDPISAENFQILLDNAPDVCFVISDQQTFSTERGDFEALQEAGIGYVPLPELNSRDNILQAVSIVAAVLETNESTGESAGSIVRRYSDWLNTIANEVSGSPQRYTLFVSEWDSNIRGYVNVDWDDTVQDGSIDEFPGNFHFCGVNYYNETFHSNGTIAHMERDFYGGAIAWSGNMQLKEPLYEFLQLANIRESGMGDPYLNERVCIRNNDRIVVISGIQFSHLTNLEVDGYNYAVHYKNFGLSPRTVVPNQGYSGAFVKPGMSAYPAIITLDEATANGIRQSLMWKYYNYNDFLQMFSNGIPTFTYDLFTSGHDIAGEYSILVNPYGFDSWVYGGVDAPLESLWAAANISGSISQEKLKSEVLGFYEIFFGQAPSYELVVH